MQNPLADKHVIEKFGGYSLFIGFLLIVLGVIGISLPAVMSLSTAFFVGWLLLVGGALWAAHTYKHSPTHGMALVAIGWGLRKTNIAGSP